MNIYKLKILLLKCIKIQISRESGKLTFDGINEITKHMLKLSSKQYYIKIKVNPIILNLTSL